MVYNLFNIKSPTATNISILEIAKQKLKRAKKNMKKNNTA